mgnify:CR=1 FL=1
MQQQAGIEGQQHRRGVAYRRGVTNVAAECPLQADLQRSKTLQHLADAGNAAGKKLADLLQRGARTQQVVVIKFAADFERSNLLQRNQQRNFLMLLGYLQAEIGATGNQLRVVICLLACF